MKKEKIIESCLNKFQLNYLWAPYDASIGISYSFKSLSPHALLSNWCRWFINKTQWSLLPNVANMATAKGTLSNLWLSLVLKTNLSTMRTHDKHSYGLCWKWASIQMAESSKTAKYRRHPLIRHVWDFSGAELSKIIDYQIVVSIIPKRTPAFSTDAILIC